MLKRILKKYGIRKLTLLCSDSLSFFVGLVLASAFVGGYRHGNVLSSGADALDTMLFMSIVFSLLFFKYGDLYKQRVYHTTAIQLYLLLKGVIWTFLFLLALRFFFFPAVLVTRWRLSLMVFLTVSYGLSFFGRLALRPFLSGRSKNWSFGRRNIIAIGAGRIGAGFAKQLHHNDGLGLKLVGFLDDNVRLMNKKVEGVRVLGNTAEIERIVRQEGIDEIFLTISSINHQSLLDLIEKCRNTDCQINIVSNHFGVVEKKVGRAEFKDLRCVAIRGRRSTIYQNHIKRFIDLVGATVIAVVILPFLIVLAILVKISSNGPVLYSSTSIGRNGNPFKFYKFRSMFDNVPNEIHKELVKDFITGKKTDGKKIQNDPRITSIGRFMRKYSLDEFAQLINVINGDMSLVGPRPSTTYEYEMMEPWHRKRFSVLPGMTGLWQVAGRAEVGFTDAIMLDIYYIENCSFWMDFMILLKTIRVVFAAKGGS